MSDNTIAKARQRLHDLYVVYAHPIQDVVIQDVRVEASRREHEAVERYGWERLFGEVQRQRKKSTGGLRRGESVVSNTGEQTSLPLMGMTIPQARANNERKRMHAAGAIAEAEFERQIIDLAEHRARERGLDPETIELVLADFVDIAEVIELRRDAA